MTKLFKQGFQWKETTCTLLTDVKNAIPSAIASIKRHRAQLEKHVQKNPLFLYSLRPVPVNKGPRITKLMAEAAKKANVGPMAAVAGVLADLAVEALITAGSTVAIVENGGEIAAVSNKTVDVALSAGDAPLSRQIGFRLDTFPTGVATSSGLFSHALSFGMAEAVTVFALNAGVADAAATAVGNQIRGNDVSGVIEKGIDEALGIEMVVGVLILYNGMVGKGGYLPPMINVKP